MFTNYPTKTKSVVDANNNKPTIAPCLNKTVDKYDNQTVELTVVPGNKQ